MPSPLLFPLCPWELGVDEIQTPCLGTPGCAEGAVRTVVDPFCTVVQVSSDLSCSLHTERRQLTIREGQHRSVFMMVMSRTCTWESPATMKYWRTVRGT